MGPSASGVFFTGTDVFGSFAAEVRPFAGVEPESWTAAVIGEGGAMVCVRYHCDSEFSVPSVGFGKLRSSLDRNCRFWVGAQPESPNVKNPSKNIVLRIPDSIE